MLLLKMSATLETMLHAHRAFVDNAVCAEAPPHAALPQTATTGDDGVLRLDGCSVQDLVAAYGSPLYVYSAPAVRRAARVAVAALGAAGAVHYAAKAYLARWLLALLCTEGVQLDVCSETELQLALRWGFPAGEIRLHGNNKTDDALHLAVATEIGATVVDSLPELGRLINIAGHAGRPARVLLRLNPGIEAHTHRYLQTGTADSKFGLALADGAASSAVDLALAHPAQVNLLGYHAHIGTQILELEPYRVLMRTLLDFSASTAERTGYWPRHLSPGGGPGITYTDEQPLPLAPWLTTLRAEVDRLPTDRRPLLSVEPGRAIIGPAGVALYRVGTRKEQPGGRTYLSVDGGMADNIRPALYEARYTALPATRMHAPTTQCVTIAGPYCESGDILVHDATLPDLGDRDLIALPATGAYCLQMSSNYNGALRPAVVVSDAGSACLVQRRQTTDDLEALEQS